MRCGLRNSPIASVLPRSGPAPASAGSLAATLQALDGNGYRSHVDAPVWAKVSAVMAELLNLSSAGVRPPGSCSPRKEWSRDSVAARSDR